MTLPWRIVLCVLAEMVPKQEGPWVLEVGRQICSYARRPEIILFNHHTYPATWDAAHSLHWTWIYWATIQYQKRTDRQDKPLETSFISSFHPRQKLLTWYSSVSSATQSCPTLCDPINCSMPGHPVHHQLPEFTQTHVHQVGDAIQER